MTWHEATTGEGALGVDETDPSREQGAGSRESAPDGGSFKYGYHGEVSPYGTAPSTPIESTSGSFKQEGFASARPPRGSPLSSPAQSPAQSPLNSPIMQRRRLWPQGRGGLARMGRSQLEPTGRSQLERRLHLRRCGAVGRRRGGVGAPRPPTCWRGSPQR